jgi:hypothetical protein
MLPAPAPDSPAVTPRPAPGAFSAPPPTSGACPPRKHRRRGFGDRLCTVCGSPLRARARADAKTCSGRCRIRALRERKAKAAKV